MSRASIPTTMGLQAPVKANVGEAEGKGIDLSIDYQQHFHKDMWITARANFTYSSSKYKVYEEPEYNEPWLSRVNHPLSQQWGYLAERLFVDDYEALNSPRQNFGVYQGGDIKYRDINDDGQITTLDMVPIGHPTLPEIIYGFGFSAGYRNIDVSCFFQGLARESFWIDPKATAPFTSYRYQSEIDNGELGNVVLQNQLLAAYANDHWSEDNPNIYALWPRLSSIPNENNAQTSTWFMQNGAFLRLKTVEVGYNLTGQAAKKVHMDHLRFYVSGTNLFTASKFKLWDVEMGSNGLGYPIQKVFNLGIRASF